MIETWTHVMPDDEPCYGMWVSERDDGHFVTRLKVRVGDHFEFAEIDHGPNPEYSGKIPPLGVPSVEGENPVGLMREMSAAHRVDLRWYRMALEQQQGSTLIKDVIRQEEQALAAVRNRSAFGPYQTTQRNGHNHSQVVRDFMDQRAEFEGKRRFAT
jgi:hypothetical protein